MFGPDGPADRRSQVAGRRPPWTQMPLRGNKLKRTTSPRATLGSYKMPQSGLFFANCDRPPANCVHFMSLSRRNAASESEERARGSSFVARKNLRYTRMGCDETSLRVMFHNLHILPFISRL